MTNALVPTRTEELMFMPVMDMEVAIARRNYVVEFVKRIMVENTDFGKIPGTGDKPTLLKPGAEKLSTFFGLTPIFVPVAVDEDWTGTEHKGEPFFYYRYRCELHRNGQLIATSEGSCNAWEAKYRYRKAERVCPTCGQSAIIKGKTEYGGGWVCFAKKGGCGGKFKDGDTSIESQEMGRVNNPDMADVVNTIQKMAQKRALVAAVLLAVNASEFFTQDIEDMAIDAEWTAVSESEAKPKAQNKGKGQQPPQEPPVDNPWEDGALPDILTDDQRKELNEVGGTFYGEEWQEQSVKLSESVSKGAVKNVAELTTGEATKLINGIKKKAAEVAAAQAKAKVESKTKAQPEKAEPQPA